MRILALLPLAAASACSLEPAKLYPGPERPPGRVATLMESADTDVIAIDGQRVRGGGWLLAPGVHEIWVRAQVRRARRPRGEEITGPAPGAD